MKTKKLVLNQETVKLLNKPASSATPTQPTTTVQTTMLSLCC